MATNAAYRRRDLTTSLLAALEDMPVVVVTGMRQTGKSTLLINEPALAPRRYVSLDDFATLEAARRDPEALLSGDSPLTIDEVQKAPELLTVIKGLVDRRRTPGRFLLSGSANLGLLDKVTESLAGRAVYLTLQPFTRRELGGDLDTEPFLVRFSRAPELPSATTRVHVINPEEVLRGGMPSVCLGKPRDPSVWFRGFEQTYLERDVRALANVGDLVAFRNLLVLAALRSGQILNVSELGRDARLSAATAGRHLGILDASFVIRRIGPYLSNRASRLIKSPKLYMTDSGLAAHLAGVETIAADAEEPMRGALFETWVAQNLAGILDAHLPSARFHFWHVQGRHEVDFVVEAGRAVVAIEVKAATRWSDRDLAPLRTFLAATPRCRAAILAHNGTAAVSLGNRLWALPLALLLS